MEQQRPRFLTRQSDQHKVPSFVSAKVPLSTGSPSRVRLQHLMPGTSAAPALLGNALYLSSMGCSNACSTTPTLANIPANSHTPITGHGAPLKGWLGSATSATQRGDCSWFTTRLKPWQNKDKPTATNHPGPPDGPKKGRQQSWDVDVYCQSQDTLQYPDILSSTSVLQWP